MHRQPTRDKCAVEGCENPTDGEFCRTHNPALPATKIRLCLKCNEALITEMDLIRGICSFCRPNAWS